MEDTIRVFKRSLWSSHYKSFQENIMEVPISWFSAVFCVSAQDSWMKKKMVRRKRERQRGKGIRAVSVVSEQHQIKSVRRSWRNVIGTEGIDCPTGDWKKHLHHHHCQEIIIGHRHQDDWSMINRPHRCRQRESPPRPTSRPEIQSEAPAWRPFVVLPVAKIIIVLVMIIIILKASPSS